MIIPKTHEQANELLRERCEVQRSLDRIAGRMNARIDKAKAEAAEEGQGHAERAAQIDDALQTWFAAELPSLGKVRSLTLLFGRVGVRAARALELVHGWKEERVIAALKATGLRGVTRTKEVLNREGIREAWSDPNFAALYRKCGLRYERSETFFVEPDVAALDTQETSEERR